MLEQNDIDRLKEIFVTRRECQETTEELEHKLGTDDVRLSVMENDLKQLKWLVATVLAASLGTLVNSILGLLG